ncbi:DUF1553 domain-containing protein [Blastopirellula sp. JC732]|uniref:DUF1553 domain-containing protein n=1 Tax=Blastopirellula sediminis TaxID=2894196 RepID=A0A9X1MIM6_9BACT|nr:DUF1553 domain-containing protein [Blastopirellula sediminis]MCC9609440.1 DUF1553 domain-containing protein [Blastopirellula sediminis]MCC9627783.1 DUF1553 domain-containing protein [Blastopirellula sediminis]
MKLVTPKWIARNTLLAGLLLFLGFGTATGADFFQDEVAPILQKKCLSCHSGAEPKGDFSLQSASAALADGYIEPGDAAASHLVELITPTNGTAEMPKDADPLSAAELAVIRKWIDNGAKWPEEFVLKEPAVADFTWWSYQPLVRPSVPEADDGWARTPIDHFILQTWKDRGLHASPAADRRTLIRRVTYDLIGLPPTPEEIAAFEQDNDPQAYEKLVDRLLASDHYGERWARHWLDVAKYADTCGYDKDKLRPNAWPYRDYVIRSLNEDKPYGRFVQEQIAGDVLFPGEPDGVLGLGFLAAGPWDFIGHVEVPESKIDGKVARNLDRDDVVSNVINSFCSVTVQCARCHNHKFDPITQENYYGLQAAFAAIDRAERPYDQVPEVLQQQRELEKQKSQLKSDLAKLDQQIKQDGGPRLEEIEKSLAQLKSQAAVEKTPEFGYHSAIVASPTTEKWVEVDLGQPAKIAQLAIHPCHDEFGGIGAGFGFPVRFQVQVALAAGEWVTVADHTKEDFPNPGLTPLMIDGAAEPIRFVRVTATQLTERKDDYILALSEVEAINAAGENVALGAKVTSLDSIEAPIRWARTNLTDGKWARDPNPDRGAKVAELTAERKRLVSPEREQQLAQLQTSLASIERKITELPKSRMVYAAATEFPTQGNFKATGGAPRTIRLLHRGDVQNPREELPPGVLPLASDSNWRFSADMPEGERRAAVARWLTDKDHPLVWRSIVNRIWQYHFGDGIVATPNDFGRMGAKPTHPELLDWLACEFRDDGQSLKKLHRMIVTSNVYRQSSAHDEEQAEIDAGNQYLWRMNRRRLEAEEIRDSILAVSGALNTKMGGPGFYLFALEKTEHSPHYEYHKFDPSDPASHRRSIYRFIVRSQPDPWMTTLDCADSSQSTPRRNETLTSLQALSLLNNPFNLLMAEKFADGLQQEYPTLPEQVDRAVLLTTGQKPTDAQRAELVAYAEQHQLVNLCRLLFNLSEFVFVD